MKAIKPITKDEVKAMTEKFRDIDARPVKKVAEAKACKRRLVMKHMETARQKATAIADLPDLNKRSKSRQMERLHKYASVKKKENMKKEVVVAKKGGKGSRGRFAKGKIMVDKRMKAEKRGEERAKKRGPKGNKGGRKSGGKSGGKAGGRAGGRK